MGEVDRERCGAREETRERDREMGIRSGLGLRRCVGTRGESGRARVRKRSAGPWAVKKMGRRGSWEAQLGFLLSPSYTYF